MDDDVICVVAVSTWQQAIRTDDNEEVVTAENKNANLSFLMSKNNKNINIGGHLTRHLALN